MSASFDSHTRNSFTPVSTPQVGRPESESTIADFSEEASFDVFVDYGEASDRLNEQPTTPVIRQPTHSSSPSHSKSLEVTLRFNFRAARHELDRRANLVENYLKEGNHRDSLVELWYLADVLKDIHDYKSLYNQPYSQIRSMCLVAISTMPKDNLDAPRALAVTKVVKEFLAYNPFLEVQDRRRAFEIFDEAGFNPFEVMFA